MNQSHRFVSQVSIMGLSFPCLDYQRALEIFEQWIIERKPHQVCVANVHTTVTCLKDKDLRDINNKSLITMDGLPLVWYANLVRDAEIKERVCGPELMLRCFDHGRTKGWTHFFLGGKEDVLNDLVKAVKSRYSGVDIVGWYSPPFRALSSIEDKQLIDRINQSSPDFLWVGLGAPKQEKWIAAHLTRINAPVQIGVGAAFDFHSGHLQRSPGWMQKAGLEWFFRLLQDKRLINRYFSTNPVFLMLFLRDFINIKLLKKQV